MISVIIPVYNVEKYLHVCLNSILKQTYQNFEIICIDDKSSDSSLEILKFFSRKDSRITIIENDTNKGQGYSRNIGLDVAKGKYISFLDADDWLTKNAYNILINYLEKLNLDMIMFKNIVYYENSKKFGMEKYYNMDFMEKFNLKVFNHLDLDKTKLFRIPNGPVNKIYLKSFLDENNIKFPNKKLIHEDNPFFYKVITTAKRISFVNEYFYNRRRRSNSIMTLNNSQLLDNIDICYLVLDIFLKNPQLYERYKKEVLTYIFEGILNTKYNQIESKYQKKFYNETLEIFDYYYRKGLKEDIHKNVDDTILKIFKQC